MRCVRDLNVLTICHTEDASKCAVQVTQYHLYLLNDDNERQKLAQEIYFNHSPPLSQ